MKRMGWSVMGKTLHCWHKSVSLLTEIATSRFALLAMTKRAGDAPASIIGSYFLCILCFSWLRFFGLTFCVFGVFRG